MINKFNNKNIKIRKLMKILNLFQSRYMKIMNKFQKF